MKMDIAFGQYCHGDSVLHRLDPRVKIVTAIIFIVEIFLAKSIAAFSLVVAATVVLILLSGISPKIILRGIKPIVFVILLTAVINIFFVRGEKPLVEFYFIRIYPEGLINAAFIAFRIIILIVGTSLFLTYTTTPIALTDGLEQLLYPLDDDYSFEIHPYSDRGNGKNNERAESARRRFFHRWTDKARESAYSYHDSSFRLCFQKGGRTCNGNGMQVLYRRKGKDETQRSACRS